MGNIGGNIFGDVQVNTPIKNPIGETVKEWKTEFTIRGWLGLQSGGSNYQNHLAKIEESTHVFLCDYHEGVYGLGDKDVRMIVRGYVYDVLLIDNPDELDEQLEIYLRRVGAWNG